MNAGKRWHDRALNPEVRFGYHALAIDERRRDFEPCPWDEADAAEGQTIEQVWFAGVHSDVGGWYDERGLSNVALHRMLGKARDCGLRIAGRGSHRAPRPARHDAPVLDRDPEGATPPNPENPRRRTNPPRRPRTARRRPGPPRPEEPAREPHRGRLTSPAPSLPIAAPSGPSAPLAERGAGFPPGGWPDRERGSTNPRNGGDGRSPLPGLLLDSGDLLHSLVQNRDDADVSVHGSQENHCAKRDWP